MRLTTWRVLVQVLGSNYLEHLGDVYDLSRWEIRGFPARHGPRSQSLMVLERALYALPLSRCPSSIYYYYYYYCRCPSSIPGIYYI